MRWMIGIAWALMLLACQPKEYPKLLQSEEIALANPIVIIDSILFKRQATISVLSPYPQAEVRYTTDNKVVMRTSPICPKSLILNENTDIQFKAFHKELNPSDTQFFSVRKATNTKPRLLETSTPAKAPYDVKGLGALSNFQKGKINFRANEEWLGYQNDTIELHLLFDEATYSKQITLSTLCDHNSWIFNPFKIEIIQNNDIISTKNIDIPQANQAAALQFFDLPIATSLKEVSLKIYMNKIPDWHSGKGTMPWFFIDEIIVDTNH